MSYRKVNYTMKRMMNALATLVAISLSAIAGVISVLGLMTIFAGNPVWVAIVAGSLEVAKVVVATWLHIYWKQLSFAFRVYLTTAVLVLMFITSLGIYGFFAKAHIDQKISISQNSSIIDLSLNKKKLDQLNTLKDTLTNQENQLQNQVNKLSAAVTATVGGKQTNNQRTDIETARKDLITAKADLASISIQRIKVLSDIGDLEAKQVLLTASSLRLEAEVGPIKYVAAWFTNDTGPEQLETAVRYMILLLVLTFDPLAIMLIMASSGNISKEKSELVPVSAKIKLPSPIIFHKPTKMITRQMGRSPKRYMRRKYKRKG